MEGEKDSYGSGPKSIFSLFAVRSEDRGGKEKDLFLIPVGNAVPDGGRRAAIRERLVSRFTQRGAHVIRRARTA